MSSSWDPARLLCSWNSPGKNTGVGCHFLPYRKKKKDYFTKSKMPLIVKMLFHEPWEMRKWCQLPHDTMPSCQLKSGCYLISETLPCRESVHLRTNELECKGKIHLFQLPSLGQDPSRTSTIFLLSERARSPGEVRGLPFPHSWRQTPEKQVRCTFSSGPSWYHPPHTARVADWLSSCYSLQGIQTCHSEERLQLYKTLRT